MLRGSPLAEDVYALKHAEGLHSDTTAVNTRLPYNGTSSTFAKPTTMEPEWVGGSGWLGGWIDTGLMAVGYYGADNAAAVWGGAAEGARGGLSITTNTLTFGGSDYVGLTDSGQYQGPEYTASRILSTIGREALITAATLGVAQVARGGIAGASWSARLVNAAASSPTLYRASRGVATGMVVYDAASGGYHIGNGAARVYEGDRWGWAEIATGGLQVFGSVAAARELAQPRLGGAYADVRASNIGGEVHHTPAKQVNGLSQNVRRADDPGPSFWMETLDHRGTGSWGPARASRSYRVAQEAAIRAGNFRGAVQMDVFDVTYKFPRKYDQGIQEMMNYVNRLERSGLLQR